MGSWCAAALVFLSLLSPALAAERVVSSTGITHTVFVESRAGGYNSSQIGTRLVYRMQSLDETIQTTIIPGTDEALAESDPTILLSPGTERPVIFWTRGDGAESEITFSFFIGSGWTPTVTLTQNDTMDRSPQIFWGPSGYLHVVWSGPASLDGPPMYEAVLDSKGVVVVQPTVVETIPSAIVTTATEGIPTLSASDALFAVDTTCKLGSRVTVQGGYDEPVPVHKRVDFVLPAGATSESSKIEVVNEIPVLFVKSGSRVFYSYQRSTGWTTLRSITLDASTDERSAEILIRTMLEGFSAP